MRSTLLRAIAALAAFCCAAPVSGAWQTLGQVRQVQRADDSLTLLTSSGAAVRIAFTSAAVVRVRVQPAGDLARDFSYAVPDRPTSIKLRVSGDGTVLNVRAASGLGASVQVTTAPQVL